MLKVLLQPTLEQVGLDNGVGQVIANHLRYFPQVDIEIVNEGQSYDLSASHLGYNVNADVHHNHGLWLGGIGPDRADQNAMIIESVRRARQIIVPSNYVAAYFKRDMRIEPNVIGHGVNWEEWQNADNRGYILWDKNRPSDVCDPHPVSVLAKYNQSLSFVTTFVEEGVTLPNIRQIGRIPFEKMRRIVLGAHIYLATTKETFGIATLQAMAAGIPIVGYNWGGTADIVRNGIDGALAEPGNEDQLNEAFAFVNAHRNELGANARERAKEYSWLEVAKQVRDVYDRAMCNYEPTVSVVIPTYNYSDFLPRAVQSACEQTGDNVIEVIIVDDGSTDDTPSVAHQLMRYDNRIRYIRQTNGGVATARNRGIQYANGKYICCLDADDEIKPAFIETMVDALERNRGLRLAYSKIELVFPNGNRGVGPWPNAFDADAMLRGENQVPTCCVFYKEDWAKLGGYKQRYCPKGYGAEDAEFWLRFAKHGLRAGLVTDEPLFAYHLGGGTSKDYKEPKWLDWHSDLKTGWYPFAALNDGGVHAVSEYDQPLYSVVIPVGPGHEIYLEDALDSVEAQTDKRWECIVVWNMRPDVLFDNGVVDRIHFAYPFVKFINAWEKQGAGYARNVGAKHAVGKYLVFLDADDYLQPRFLELTRKVAELHGEHWVYTDLYAQTDDKMDLFECFDFDVERLWRQGIMGVTCLYSRAAFDAAGGFDEQYNREDWDFHLRLARAGICALHLPLPLFTYRQQLGYRREYRKVANTPEESKALKVEDVKRIHGLFNLEELKMACGGCRKKVEIETVSGNDLLTMVYVGKNKTMINEVTFVGPITGARYRTSDGRIVNVHPQDALAFEERRLFKGIERIAPQEPIVAARPKVPVVQELSWKEQVKVVNDAAMDASRAAREETEKALREIFGEDYVDEPLDQPIEQDLWWQAPENQTVPQNETMLLTHKLTNEQLEVMYKAESEGKNRSTLLRIIKEQIK